MMPWLRSKVFCSKSDKDKTAAKSKEKTIDSGSPKSLSKVKGKLVEDSRAKSSAKGKLIENASPISSPKLGRKANENASPRNSPKLKGKAPVAPNGNSEKQGTYSGRELHEQC